MSAIYEFGLCPFCQCSKVKIEEARGRDQSEDYFFVECHFCGAQGPTADSRDQAVSRWNERCSDDAPVNLVNAEAVQMLRQIVARNGITTQGVFQIEKWLKANSLGGVRRG